MADCSVSAGSFAIVDCSVAAGSSDMADCSVAAGSSDMADCSVSAGSFGVDCFSISLPRRSGYGIISPAPGCRGEFICDDRASICWNGSPCTCDCCCSCSVSFCAGISTGSCQFAISILFPDSKIRSCAVCCQLSSRLLSNSPGSGIRHTMQQFPLPPCKLILPTVLSCSSCNRNSPQSLPGRFLTFTSIRLCPFCSSILTNPAFLIFTPSSR